MSAFFLIFKNFSMDLATGWSTGWETALSKCKLFLLGCISKSCRSGGWKSRQKAEWSDLGFQACTLKPHWGFHFLFEVLSTHLLPVQGPITLASFPQQSFVAGSQSFNHLNQNMHLLFWKQLQHHEQQIFNLCRHPFFFGGGRGAGEEDRRANGHSQGRLLPRQT